MNVLVLSCSGCPLFADTDMGTYCNHPHAEYPDIENYEIVQEWCPLHKEHITITVEVG